MRCKRQATLKDWCIVRYPEICIIAENPEMVFSTYGDDLIVVLLGKAVDDPRFNADMGEFAEGHRLVTSPVIKVEGDEYHTLHTIYILKEEQKSEEYRKWCEENP